MPDYDRDAYLTKLKDMNQEELEDELIELMKNPATAEVVRKFIEERGQGQDSE